MELDWLDCHSKRTPDKEPNDGKDSQTEKVKPQPSRYRGNTMP